MNARATIKFTLILTAILSLPRFLWAAPAEPMGLRGARNPAGTVMTLLWDPVAGAAGYNVYRRTSPTETPSKINPFLNLVPAYADYTGGQTLYYSVRAVDAHGHESSESVLVDSSEKINLLFVAPDEQTTLIIPGSLGHFLRSTHNEFGVPLTVAFSETQDLADSGLVRSVNFRIVRADNGQTVSNLALPSPEAEIRVGYDVTGSQVAVSALAAINATPEQLCLFWFNGVSWIKLGGTNNPGDKTVTIKSAQLGTYQLRIAPKAATLSLGKANVFPALFTPNGDGFNDRVYFVLENPNNAAVSGEIFDMSGRTVTTLAAPVLTPGLGTTLSWTGKDSSGGAVASGIYMYRIEGDGQIITGTVSVAR